jgi:hypothetical protein
VKGAAKSRAVETKTERRDPMSKRKIDETMTEARNARAKKKDEAMLPPIVPRAKRSKKAETQKAEAEPETKPANAKGVAKEKAPKEELVVFAFRLTPDERDAIHKAAGPAKASKYVRTLAVAAAKGDETAVKEIMQAAGNPAA